MSKKKKKTRPLLDDAARARVAARRERKNARRVQRGKMRFEKAKQLDPVYIAERTLANEATLKNDAWIVVDADGITVAGLLPPSADGTTQLIRRNGESSEEAPFDRDYEALLWLYAEAYAVLHPRPSLEHLMASLRGEDVKPFAPQIPEVIVIARSEAAEGWMNAAHDALIAQHRSNSMDVDDVDLFYEFIADETMKREVREREADGEVY